MIPELFYIVIALLIGIIAGTFTGLIPGIHTNTLAALLLASLSIPFFSSIPLTALSIFIVSMAITHTFISFIPSIYLGAPDEDTFLSILPGHEFMKQGLGHTAVVLTLYGSILALPVILIFTPIFIRVLPSLFNLTKSSIPYILIFISFYLIAREERFISGILCFLLSGFLGFITFSLPVKEPLLPLLTGLFGVSTLIVSLKNHTSPKNQKILPLKQITLKRKDLIKGSLASFFVAPFFSFLPGMGSGHASLLGSELFNIEKKGFIFLTGAVNTIVVGLSFITIYVIGKSRTGAAAAVKDILQEIIIRNIYQILLTIFIVSIFAFFLGLYLSKLFAKLVTKINYTRLTIATLLILFLINLILSNPLGLLVLVSASSLGVFAILSKSRRINLMAALIIPVIIYYLA